MTPEKKLWQAVVFRAFLDATIPEDGSESQDSRLEKRRSDSWIRSGKDFREVVEMAGMDPDFLREAYIAGRIDRKRLKSLAGGDE